MNCRVLIIFVSAASWFFIRSVFQDLPPSPLHELELIKRPLVTSVKLHPCLEASPDGRPLTEKQRCSGSYRRAVSFQVFKDDSISQRPSLRRLRSRSTVHARRNLPVKEFCYLRTVNLTAAMCFGAAKGNGN